MKVNALHISDIHLGNSRVPVDNLIDGMWHVIKSGMEGVDALHILYICGDLFDKALMVPANSIPGILKWIIDILKFCAKHDIQLRVLEGTLSHDRKQSKLLTTINDAADLGCDLLYADKLMIEDNTRYGIKTLYMPDDLNVDTTVTWRQITALMETHKLDKVDNCITHGTFTYQIPDHVVNVPTHSEHNFISITKRYIANGHHHNPTKYDIINVPGSLGRLSHGEEHKKGGLLMTMDLDVSYHYKVKRIDNPLAIPFVTVDCIGLGYDKANDKINKAINKLPIGSNVRVRYKDGDEAELSYKGQMVRNKDITWTNDICSKDMADVDKDMAATLETMEVVRIDRTNVVDLAKDVMVKNGLSADLSVKVVGLLENALSRMRN